MMITASEESAGSEIKKRLKVTRLGLKSSASRFSHSPRIFLLPLAFFIFLTSNNTIYCATEYDRQDMNLRARTELEEILSKKEFKGQNPQPPWWSRWVGSLLRRLPGGGISWVFMLLKWLFYLVVIFLIVFVCVSIAKYFRRSPFSTANRDVPTDFRRRTDPESARRQAHEYSQQGEYSQAIRYLYLSLLLYLDRAGSLIYDPGKTNGEYIGEIRGNTENKAEHFAFLTSFFERKWYGMEESSAGDFQQCEETFAELVVGL